MDEETRTGLISEAIQRRIMEGLEKIQNDPNQTDLEEYLKSMEDG
jgi:hypothetical protein